MRLRKSRKVIIYKAVGQSFKNIVRSWKLLLLFASISILMNFATEFLLAKSGLMSFFGGFFLSQMILGVVKLLYIMVIIKVTSDLMKGELNSPQKIIRTTFSKIGLILFQGLIVGALLVPGALILLFILMGVTQSSTFPAIFTKISVGVVLIKIIFSFHGVIINNIDSMESVKDSISITNGNFIKLVFTVAGLWMLNDITMDYLVHLKQSSSLIYLLTFIPKSFMTIIQVTLITSMYHQLVPVKFSQRAESEEIL
ncbi:MAG: hypothetical protein JXR88_09945 [Clostridia bacterium]|nr:hypothetical protein [Clostridia bacterium]